MFLAGAAGALCKEIIIDNKLTLPKKVNGELCLGFIGSIIIGGFAGYLIDHNPAMAFMSGYTGFSVIANFIEKTQAKGIENTPTTPEIKTVETGPTEVRNLPNKESTEEMIRRIATEEKVDQELAVNVARCESGFNPKAININTTGSKDRGLYQINDYYHPEVTDEQAYNPEWATRWFCKAIREGHISWWNASKKCWDK